MVRSMRMAPHDHTPTCCDKHINSPTNTTTHNNTHIPSTACPNASTAKHTPTQRSSPRPQLRHLATTAGNSRRATGVDSDATNDMEDDSDEIDVGDSRDSNNPHCDINFVQHTKYKLLANATTTVIWAEGSCIDPQPKPPEEKSDTHIGDYLLFKGDDIKLKIGPKSSTKTVFMPSDELILQNDWTPFEEEMTGQDVVELGDETFLLWWQNIAPPKIKAAKASKESKTAKTAKRKRR
jgi:hypothetical protein